MIEIQDTSIEAYESVNRGNDSWYSQVLRALEDNPSTCDELEVALQGRHQTISSRIRKVLKTVTSKALEKKDQHEQVGKQSFGNGLYEWDVATESYIGCEV